MDGTVETPADIEHRLRHQITAATLLLVSEDILGYSGHVSARLLAVRLAGRRFQLVRLCRNGRRFLVELRRTVKLFGLEVPDADL